MTRMETIEESSVLISMIQNQFRILMEDMGASIQQTVLTTLMVSEAHILLKSLAYMENNNENINI